MTLPLIEEPSVLEFVMARFLKDLRRCLRQEFPEDKGRLVVTYTTHTNYYDQDRRVFVCDPPKKMVNKTAVAQVPAITMGSFTWTRNRDRYGNQDNYIPKQFKNCEGHLTDGAEKRNPTEFLDVSLSMTLFENKPQDLLKLQSLVFRYFDLYPYLFIPEDFSNRDGLPETCDVCSMVQDWYAGRDLGIPGFFVRQAMPVDQTVFTTDIRASIDNLFTAQTNILIEEIPIPDGLILGNLELLQAVQADIFAVEPQETFEEREDEIHSSFEVGDFKECG